MAIVLTNTTSSSTNVIVDPSTAAGQFLFAPYMDDDAPTNPIGMPPGFVQEANNYFTGDGGNTALTYLLSSAGGSGNLTFNALADAIEACLSYTGVATGTPFDVVPTVTLNAFGISGSNAWVITPPPITTVTDGCRILVIVMVDLTSLNNSITSATGSPLTQRVISNSVTLVSSSLVVLDDTQVTLGTYTPANVTVNMSTSASGGYAVYTAALRPAGTGGGAAVSVAGIHYVTA